MQRSGRVRWRLIAFRNEAERQAGLPRTHCKRLAGQIPTKRGIEAPGHLEERGPNVNEAIRLAIGCHLLLQHRELDILRQLRATSSEIRLVARKRKGKGR